MEIKDFTDEQLVRHYAGLLKEIKHNQKLKKEFEEEFERRFNKKLEKKG